MSLLSKHSSRKQSSFKKSKSKSMEVNYTDQDLSQLRRKRTLAAKRLDKALEIGTLAINDDSQRNLFLSYYPELKHISDSFEDAHQNILDLLDDPDHVDNTLQDNFDDKYFKILSIHRSLTKSEPQVNHNQSSSSSNIRLPKIVLPSFSGDIKKWPEYHDTFNALIHNSSSLTATEKFHYLFSSLTGDALSVIKAFPLTHEHYNDAYQALVTRYHRKRPLAYTSWRDLLSINFETTDGNEFRKSLDLFEENLIILKNIILPEDRWDFVLVYHLLSRIDSNVRCDFEEKYPDIEFPSYAQLKSFLHLKCEALLRDSHFCETNTKTSSKPQQQSVKSFQLNKRSNVSHALVGGTDKPRPVAASTASGGALTLQTVKCAFCGEAHSISSCQQFHNKPVDERISIASKNNWCYNCLRSSHQLKGCTSIFKCRKCNHKHHTLLHKDKPVESNPTSSLFSNNNNTTVLLATAIVQVRDADGKFVSFRALFDSGSQINLITDSAVKNLNLKLSSPTTTISGIGEAPASILGDVNCSIGTGDQILFNLNMHVMSKICGDQPIAKLNTSGWSHINSLPLADPGFDIPGRIDLLFGADVFAESLRNRQIKGKSPQPTAFDSVFGWLLFGKTRLASHSLGSLLNTSVQNDKELNSVVQRFWELEVLPKAASLTPDEIACEQHFITTHSRDSSGRYTVQLPFRDGSEPIFAGSRDIALRRFYAIERRLSRDPECHRQYSEFMSDYLNAGHMSLVSPDDVGNGKYYIPHHCVVRPDSTTTRLRVVFDASAKDARSRSLNESQHIGPKLQSNILEILLRFREHDVVFMADVRQMYRQITLFGDHRDYQRILWRASPDEPLLEFRLNTVTYGISSSPYLACRTLRQLADDEGDSFPLAKSVILSDTYIDDVVSGSQDLMTAQKTKTQLIALFKKGGFHLRKWVSNDNRLLSDLQSEDCLTGSVSLDNSEPASFKVLGLKWDPSTDSFLFEVESSHRPCTKRSILSELARIFDPLGFLSPLTIQAKSLIQKLWIIGAGWDEVPPDEVISTWNKYKDQLSQLKHLKISRRLTRTDASSYELHGFCDSSEIAYGAVIYLRVADVHNNSYVHFVCSRARVVPLKRISLPRLELCAAVLLSDLYKFVTETYLSRIPISAVFLWSDSTVTLSWLRSPSCRWSTFVANRVSHIQETTIIEYWHHVFSADNPADVCSRGQFPSELLHNSLWWAGPRWLSEPHESWPSFIDSVTDDEQKVVEAETRKSPVFVSTVHTREKDVSIIDNLFNRFSSLEKIIRIVTYLYRFLQNSRNPTNANRSTFLNNLERHKALMTLVRHVQGQEFAEEITKLKSNKILLKPFSKLNPFIDERGMLRVGGRIARSGLEYEQRHPALLPSDHPLTLLIIDFVHRNYCHPGVNTTQYLVLQQFWIVSAKRVIRRCLAKCVKCYRTHPVPLQPFMSDLPAYRVSQVKPFSVVGVDFGGPFRIKLGTHRGAKIDKAYLCLFVCLATKAVHLEVVSTLSAEGFIATLRRFVGRRGRCSTIHADCGTNFVGARNQLTALLQDASSTEKIEFKFNPPSAPHFGGVWEIQIKAAKQHLYRIVGDQVLTFEELTTLFVQIEAVLNSRPMCPISSDPNDLSALTPGHFLTLEPLTAVPDEDLSNINLHRLHRWQLLQAFQQSFWSRWKHEYLNSLTQRAKWTKDSRPLKVGSLVIIRDDNRPPLDWSLGRVIELLPGADGVVRVAILKTATSNSVKRPLVKLCPLPIED